MLEDEEADEEEHDLQVENGIGRIEAKLFEVVAQEVFVLLNACTVLEVLNECLDRDQLEGRDFDDDREDELGVGWHHHADQREVRDDLQGVQEAPE